MTIRKFYDLTDWGSGGFAKPVLPEVPCSLHFVVINLASFNATGMTDKRVVSIKLTAEQQNELRQKLGSDKHGFFDVMMSFE